MIYKANTQLSNTLLDKVRDALHCNHIISFPTETVYALAGNAESDEAVTNLYRIKQRDQAKRLSLLVPSIEAAQKVALFNDMALTIASRFWPGPLTLIVPLKKEGKLAPLMTKDYDTIGIRIPDHPLALNILQSLNMTLFATSANISGSKDNTNAHDVETNLGNRIGLIIDGGASDITVPSTVLDVTSEKPTILRQGSISYETLLYPIGR